jgi:hypothetical protein
MNNLRITSRKLTDDSEVWAVEFMTNDGVEDVCVMNEQRAFERKWDSDPYTVRRTAALHWLGDRYILAHPINRKPETSHNRKTENA